MLEIEEIKRLKARYFRLLDQQRFASWGEVFTRDVEFDRGSEVLHGREEVVSLVSRVLEGAKTVHHGHMPEIELTGRTTARGTWAMMDYVEFAPQDGRRRSFVGYGHYFEEYRKDDGEWRIAKWRLVRLRVDNSEVVLQLPV